MKKISKEELERNQAKIRIVKQNVQDRRRKESSAIHQSISWGLKPVRQLFNIWRFYRFNLRREKITQEYMARDGFKGVQLGCGPNRMEGWINSDMLYDRLPFQQHNPIEDLIDFPIDITKRLPFADHSLDAIYAEELIEHVDLNSARIFFKDAKRVLKPTGVLRMTTPDIKKVCRMYLGEMDGFDLEDHKPYWLEEEWGHEIWINGMFRYWGHQFLWSVETMRRELIDAGFNDAVECAPLKTQSGISELDNVDTRFNPNEALSEFQAATTLIIETTSTHSA
jgi:predicted SAM-dependent methyltransferase